MNSLTTLFISATLVFSLNGCAEKKFTPKDALEERTKAFEKKINFDKAITNHNPSEKIMFDWSKVKFPPHLTGWTRIPYRYEITSGEFSREQWEWGYQKDDKGIGIEIKSHKLGDQTALLAIRDFSNRSNMQEPPYLKGPSDLGTISIVMPGPYSFSVYWAYRDLEFSIHASDKETALKTAYWLMSVAEAHRKPR